MSYFLHRWNILPDPEATPPKNERGLTELFAEIRATVDTEAQIVKAVFPNPPVVMQVFLQRVFAQSASCIDAGLSAHAHVSTIGPTTYGATPSSSLIDIRLGISACPTARTYPSIQPCGRFEGLRAPIGFPTNAFRSHRIPPFPDRIRSDRVYELRCCQHHVGNSDGRTVRSIHRRPTISRTGKQEFGCALRQSSGEFHPLPCNHPSALI